MLLGSLDCYVGVLCTGYYVPCVLQSVLFLSSHCVVFAPTQCAAKLALVLSNLLYADGV